MGREINTYPDLLRLSTSLIQEQVLQILREHAVTAFKLITKENRCIRRIMTSFSNGHDSSQNFLVDSYHTSSNTEQNIQRADSHSSSNAE